MKSFVVFLFIGVLQVNSIPLSSEHIEKLRSYCQECLKQTNVNEIFIEKAQKGIYIEDPTFKNFLFCVSQKVGFQDAEGIIQKDALIRKISSLAQDQGIMSKLVEECTVQKGSPGDTSFNIAKCLRQASPNTDIFKILPEKIYLPNEKTQKILAKHKECAVQDKFGEEVIENALKQGILLEDTKFKDYVYCFSKKQGFQHDDGVINKEALYNKFADILEDSVVVEKLVQKCAVQQDTPENTAFAMSKCIRENLPVHIEMFPREITVPEDVAKKIIERSRACIRETGVDKEVLYKFRNGEYSDDSKVKEFALCMTKKAGVLNDAGEINVDAIKEKITQLFNDPALTEKLIAQCAIKQSSPEETAIYIKTCLHKKSPGHISFTQFGAISESQEEKQRQFIKECTEETGVSKSVILNARKGDFQDDPLLKQYFFCIYKKTGAMNEAGEYNENYIRATLTDMYNNEETIRIMEKCLKKENTPLNTSFQGVKCFYKRAPEAVVLF